MLVAEKVHGVVVIDGLVHVAIGKSADIAEPAEGEYALDPFRVAEAEVQGVIRSEACPHGNRIRMRVPPRGEGEQFVHEVPIVLLLPPGSGPRVLVVRVPRFAIDTIDAKNVEPAPVDRLVEGLHHPVIFPLVEGATRRREDDHPGTGVAKLEQGHVSVQGGAPPAMIVAMHG
jgi:hypothetical protein